MEKSFQRFQPALADGERRAALLEFDRQVFETVEGWAAQHRASFATIVDHVVTYLAGEITAATQPGSEAAQGLRILDLDRLIDRMMNRSIAQVRPAREACGNLYPSALPQTTSPAPADADPDETRRQEILGYYAALTGNRLKPSDYAKLKEIFHYPDRVIQAGILHALCYAVRPIGSFAYCVRAMENFRDADMDLEAVCAALIDKLLLKRSRRQLVLPLAGEKLLEFSP